MTTAIVIAVVGALLFSMQYGWWRRSVDFAKPRLLMYHMINNHVPKARYNKLRVPPDEFERQLRWLIRNQWNFIFMSELDAPVASKSVALTFDDGYRDNLLNADPLLEKYGAKATLYLVTDRHDRDWSTYKKAHHDSGELAAVPKLLDADVEYLLSTGRWELGAHTVTHANLLDANEEEREREIEACKSHLETKFNSVVSTFAYPFGLYGTDDVKSVSNAGYETAVTTVQGISEDMKAEALELRRVKISGNEGPLSFRIRMRTGKCRWKD